MWEIYPVLSWLNAVVLNPSEVRAFAPKFEFEFVSEMSPPFSVTKCSAYPIAKIETAWINELFDTFTW